MVDESTLQDESKFTPGAKGWLSRDGWAAEYETCQFLYGLVRLVKPKNIIEGGCGDSTRFMTRAVKENIEHGADCQIVSYETNIEYAKPLQEEGYNVLEGSCISYKGDADMVFLDTSLPERLEETEYWLDKKVLLVIHDAHRTDLIGELPGDGLVLDNPRGLWIRNKRPHRFGVV